MRPLVITFLLFFTGISFMQAQNAVPFTLEDRDRIIRTEENLKRLEQSMNERFQGIDQRFEGIDQRFEGINQRFDSLESSITREINRIHALMLWGFGMTFTFMLGLVGFVLWDRRSFMKPVQQDTKELEERERKLEKILKEYSSKQPDLAAIMKMHGLL